MVRERLELEKNWKSVLSELKAPYTLRELRSSLKQKSSLPSHLFEQIFSEFITHKYLESSQDDFLKFIEEGGIQVSSSIPSEVVPEQPAKKKPKKESVIRLYEKESELVNGFLTQLGFDSVAKEDSKIFINNFVELIKAKVSDEIEENPDLGESFDEFMYLLMAYADDEIDDEDLEELEQTITELFTKKEKSKEPEKSEESQDFKLTENILDDLRGIFDEAGLGSLGDKLSEIGGKIGDFIVDMASDIKDDAKAALEDVEENSVLKKAALTDEQKEPFRKAAEEKKAKKKAEKEKKKADKEGEKEKKKDQKATDKAVKDSEDNPFNAGDEYEKNSKKDGEQETAKKDDSDLSPDDYKKEYGKCPEGYSWNSEKNTCEKSK